MPNPSFAGGNVSLRFTLAKAQDVTLRVHDVAGRVVARLAMKGAEGPNTFEWDGRMASGARERLVILRIINSCGAESADNSTAADANPRRVSRSLLLCRVRVGAAEC